MKKLLSIITTAPAFFFFAIPAFATTLPRPGNGAVVNPCANGLDGFTNLCNFDGNNPAGLIGAVIQLLLVVAVIIALIFLIWGGIRWITSSGDKGKLDAARGTVVAAIVGLIVALAAFFIINLVLSLFNLGGLGNLHLPHFG